MRLTPSQRLIEAQDPRRRKIRSIIRDTYAETGSLALSAERLGISEGRLSAWIRDLGGEIRSEVVFPRAGRRAMAREEAAAA